MTKLKTYIIYVPIIIGLLGSFCFGLRWEKGKLEDDFPWTSQKINTSCSGNTNLGDCISIKEDEKSGGDDTIIRRLLEVFGLKKDKNDDLKFINYAKAIVNLALTLLAFIALIMSIYTFYLMIFSENEAGIKKAKGNLIGIFIALGVIGLARLIVSVIFRRYQNYRLAEENNIPTLTDKILETQQE